MRLTRLASSAPKGVAKTSRMSRRASICTTGLQALLRNSIIHGACVASGTKKGPSLDQPPYAVCMAQQRAAAHHLGELQLRQSALPTATGWECCSTATIKHHSRKSCGTCESVLNQTRPFHRQGKTCQPPPPPPKKEKNKTQVSSLNVVVSSIAGAGVRAGSL